VTLLYGSMYGNTEKMMNAVAQGISQVGVPVEIFDVARTHVAYILPSLWVHRGVIVGAPTYEGGLFPPMAQVLDVAARKRIVNRKAAYFGSYGWSGGARREFAQLAESLHWEVMDTFEFPGGPTAEDLGKGEEFGARFAKLIAHSSDELNK
jgi:anaerobic nitric oxide reductase flavorubredoxin